MQSGSVVANRFQVADLAGTGGMGAVYRASDRLTGATVALKVLHGTAPGERFSLEAQLLAELRHPAIVRYVDHGVTESGVPYLAMEWLEGQTLSSRMRRQPLDAMQSLAMAARVADALAVAHARGVVHRDIKPSNIILVDGRPDRAKVLDFGVARLSGVATLRTLSGAVLGTPGYMAPEQARGERSVDGRADVFSLGCVLFQCLTGRAAFSAREPLAVLAKLVLDDTPRLRQERPDLPAELDTLVTRMLAKDPRDRPRDLAALSAELAGFEISDSAGGGPASTRATGSVITAAERRVVAVLLASDALSAMSEDTAGELERTSSEVTRVERPLRHDEEDSRVARSLQNAVAAVGGRLEPLRDGSLVVTLRGGGAATDLACRAARCALSVREILPQARLALATGRAVMGPQLPLGEVIERAAAKLDSVGAGEVCVDSVTKGLVDARFVVTADEHDVFRLSRERDDTETLRQLLGKPTPTIGREREIGFLMGLLDECLDEPMARVAVVVGPAGVGKSRVRYELLRRLGQRQTRCQTWIARADPTSAGSPFGLLGHVIRRVAGLLDGEPPAAARARLRDRVARHVPPADVERVTLFLGEIGRVPSDETSLEILAARRDPILMSDQMRRAWEELVVAECSHEPVILVLEDLHWGDLPSVKLVDAALRAASDLPFMVLALARPEVRERFVDLWGQREPQELTLGGLTRRSAEKLISEALGDAVDEATRRLLVKRADGNAFFLEELIRAAGEGNRDLPDSVLATVQMRLEALPEASRRTLRAAAVFGKAFWAGAVSALLGSSLDPDDVREWLELLSEREVVTPRARSRFPGETEYAFRHALVAEAAYAMLTPEDRQRGHLAAGSWLVENGEPEALGLAGHFEKGGDAERALDWYRQAAEEAIDGNDFETALLAVSRAKSLDRAEPDAASRIAELSRLEAEAHLWRGEYRQAGSVGERALETLEDLGTDWLRSAFVVVSACQHTGDLDRAVAIAERLLGDAHWDDPSPVLVQTAARAAVVLTHTGRFGVAERLFARLDEIANTPACADPTTQARYLVSKASRALYRGQIEHYTTWSWRASETFSQMGDRRNAAIQRHNAGHGSYELGSFHEAQEHLAAALRVATQLGLPNVVAAAKTNLGYVLSQLGQRDQARELLGEAAQMLEAQGDRRLYGAALSHLAGLCLLDSEFLAARETADRAVRQLEAFPPVRVHALARRAEAELQLGRPSEALDTTRLGMDLLDELSGAADGEMALRLCRARALDASGEPEAARGALRVALDRLLERADAIDDLALRQSFLRNVPENAQIVALGSSWLTEG